MSKSYFFFKHKERTALEDSPFWSSPDHLESWLHQNEWIPTLLIICIAAILEMLLIRICKAIKKKSVPRRRIRKKRNFDSQKKEDNLLEGVRLALENLSGHHSSSEERLDIFSGRKTSPLTPAENNCGHRILLSSGNNWASTYGSEYQGSRFCESSVSSSLENQSSFHSEGKQFFTSHRKPLKSEYETKELSIKNLYFMLKTNKKKMDHQDQEKTLPNTSTFSAGNQCFDRAPCPPPLLSSNQMEFPEEYVKHPIVLKSKASLESKADCLHPAAGGSLVQNQYCEETLISNQVQGSVLAQSALQSPPPWHIPRPDSGHSQPRREASYFTQPAALKGNLSGTQDPFQPQDSEEHQQFFKAPRIIDAQDSPGLPQGKSTPESQPQMASSEFNLDSGGSTVLPSPDPSPKGGRNRRKIPGRERTLSLKVQSFKAKKATTSHLFSMMACHTSRPQIGVRHKKRPRGAATKPMQNHASSPQIQPNTEMKTSKDLQSTESGEDYFRQREEETEQQEGQPEHVWGSSPRLRRDPLLTEKTKPNVYKPTGRESTTDPVKSPTIPENSPVDEYLTGATEYAVPFGGNPRETLYYTAEERGDLQRNVPEVEVGSFIVRKRRSGTQNVLRVKRVIPRVKKTATSLMFYANRPDTLRPRKRLGNSFHLMLGQVLCEEVLAHALLLAHSYICSFPDTKMQIALNARKPSFIKLTQETSQVGREEKNLNSLNKEDESRNTLSAKLHVDVKVVEPALPKPVLFRKRDFRLDVHPEMGIDTGEELDGLISFRETPEEPIDSLRMDPSRVRNTASQSLELQWKRKEKTRRKHRKEGPYLATIEEQDAIPLPHFELDKGIYGVIGSNVHRPKPYVSQEEKELMKKLEMERMMDSEIPLDTEESPLGLPFQQSKGRGSAGKSDMKGEREIPGILKYCSPALKPQQPSKVRKVSFSEALTLNSSTDLKGHAQEKREGSCNVDLKDKVNLICISLKEKDWPNYFQDAKEPRWNKKNKKQKIIQGHKRKLHVGGNKRLGSIPPSPHLERDLQIKEAYTQGITKFCLPSSTLQELSRAMGMDEQSTDDILSSIRKAKYEPQKDRWDAEEMGCSQRKALREKTSSVLRELGINVEEKDKKTQETMKGAGMQGMTGSPISLLKPPKLSGVGVTAHPESLGDDGSNDVKPAQEFKAQKRLVREKMITIKPIMHPEGRHSKTNQPPLTEAPSSTRHYGTQTEEVQTNLNQTLGQVWGQGPEGKGEQREVSVAASLPPSTSYNGIEAQGDLPGVTGSYLPPSQNMESLDAEKLKYTVSCSSEISRDSSTVRSTTHVEEAKENTLEENITHTKDIVVEVKKSSLTHITQTEKWAVNVSEENKESQEGCLNTTCIFATSSFVPRLETIKEEEGEEGPTRSYVPYPTLQELSSTGLTTSTSTESIVSHVDRRSQHPRAKDGEVQALVTGDVMPPNGPDLQAMTSEPPRVLGTLESGTLSMSKTPQRSGKENVGQKQEGTRDPNVVLTKASHFTPSPSLHSLSQHKTSLSFGAGTIGCAGSSEGIITSHNGVGTANQQEQSEETKGSIKKEDLEGGKLKRMSLKEGMSSQDPSVQCSSIIEHRKEVKGHRRKPEKVLKGTALLCSRPFWKVNTGVTRRKDTLERKMFSSLSPNMQGSSKSERKAHTKSPNSSLLSKNKGPVQSGTKGKEKAATRKIVEDKKNHKLMDLKMKRLPRSSRTKELQRKHKQQKHVDLTDARTRLSLSELKSPDEDRTCSGTTDELSRDREKVKGMPQQEKKRKEILMGRRDTVDPKDMYLKAKTPLVLSTHDSSDHQSKTEVQEKKTEKGVSGPAERQAELPPAQCRSRSLSMNSETKEESSPMVMRISICTASCQESSDSDGVIHIELIPGGVVLCLQNGKHMPKKTEVDGRQTIKVTMVPKRQETKTQECKDGSTMVLTECPSSSLSRPKLEKKREFYDTEIMLSKPALQRMSNGGENMPTESIVGDIMSNVKKHVPPMDEVDRKGAADKSGAHMKSPPPHKLYRTELYVNIKGDKPKERKGQGEPQGRVVRQGEGYLRIPSEQSSLVVGECPSGTQLFHTRECSLLPKQRDYAGRDIITTNIQQQESNPDTKPRAPQVNRNESKILVERLISIYEVLEAVFKAPVENVMEGRCPSDRPGKVPAYTPDDEKFPPLAEGPDTPSRRSLTLQWKSVFNHITPEDKLKLTNHFASKIIEIKLNMIPKKARLSLQKLNSCSQGAISEGSRWSLHPKHKEMNCVSPGVQEPNLKYSYLKGCLSRKIPTDDAGVSSGNKEGMTEREPVERLQSDMSTVTSAREHPPPAPILQNYSVDKLDEVLMHLSRKTLEGQSETFSRIVRESYAKANAQETSIHLPTWIHSPVKAPKEKDRILLLFDKLRHFFREKSLRSVSEFSNNNMVPVPNDLPNPTLKLIRTSSWKDDNNSGKNCTLPTDNELVQQPVSFKKENLHPKSLPFRKVQGPSQVHTLDPGQQSVEQRETRGLPEVKSLMTPKTSHKCHKLFQERQAWKTSELSTQQNAAGLPGSHSARIPEYLTSIFKKTETSPNPESCSTPEGSDSEESVFIPTNFYLNQESENIFLEAGAEIPLVKPGKKEAAYWQAFNYEGSGAHQVRAQSKHRAHMKMPACDSPASRSYSSSCKMQPSELVCRSSSSTVEIKTMSSSITYRKEKRSWSTHRRKSFSFTSSSESSAKFHRVQEDDRKPHHMHPESKDIKKTRFDMLEKSSVHWDSEYSHIHHEERHSRKKRVCYYESERTFNSPSKHQSASEHHQKDINFHSERQAKEPFVYACIPGASPQVAPKTIRWAIPQESLNKKNFRVPLVAKISNSRNTTKEPKKF